VFTTDVSGATATFTGLGTFGSLSAGATSLSGALDLNNNGITNTGSIAGATTINASGDITTSANVNAVDVTASGSGSFADIAVGPGNLIGSGSATFASGTVNAQNIAATNNVTAGNDVNASGDVNATGDVTGVDATFSGSGSFADIAVGPGNLIGSGSATFASGTVNAQNITASATVSGVTGNFSGTVSAAAFSGGTFSGTTVTASGNVDVGGDLGVAGDSILTGDLTVNGNTNLVGLTVNGPANLSTAITSGDLTVGGDLTVQGDIVSRGQTEIVVSDAFLELANGNDSTSAVSAGYAATIARNSDIVYFVQEFQSQATSSSTNAKLILSSDGADNDSTRASGAIVFGPGQPGATNTLVFELPGGGNVTFTFVAAASAVATDIFRGNNLQEAVENAVAKLNAYTDGGNRQFRAQYNAENSFSAGGTAQMLIQYDREQTGGTGGIDITGMTAGTVTSKFDFSNIPRIQVGQFIQIAQQDANEANGGLFVVATTNANEIELAANPATYVPFAQNNVQDATEEPNARPKVSFIDLYVQAVSNGVLSDNNGTIAEGVLCQGYEEFATEASFNGGYNEIGAGTVTLQNAYENGPTLTTNATIGDLEISGTEDVSITSTGSNSNISIGASDVQTSVSMHAGAGLTANQAVAAAKGVTRVDITVNQVPSSPASLELVGFGGIDYIIEFTSGTGNSTQFGAPSGNVATANIDVTTMADVDAVAAEIQVIYANTAALSDITVVNTGSPSPDLVFTMTASLTVDTTLEFQSDPADFNIQDVSTSLMAVPANADVNNGSPQFVGFATDTIAAGTSGEIVIAGTFTGIATDSDAGAPVYVSATSGSLTANAPSGSGNVIFQVGIALTQGTSPRVLIQPQFIAEVL